MRIFEYVGATTITSDLGHWRLRTPHAGDVVLIKDKKAIIERTQGDHVCIGENVCSAFLGLLGKVPYVSINGGPTGWRKISDLEPTHMTNWVEFWNWGDGTAGADRGVNFMVRRPVFTLRPGSTAEAPPEPPPLTLQERINRAFESGDVAAGIAYEWHLAGPSGASFLLLVNSEKSDTQIQRAKDYLHAQHDVVGPITIIRDNA